MYFEAISYILGNCRRIELSNDLVWSDMKIAEKIGAPSKGKRISKNVYI